MVTQWNAIITVKYIYEKKKKHWKSRMYLRYTYRFYVLFLKQFSRSVKDLIVS